MGSDLFPSRRPRPDSRFDDALRAPLTLLLIACGALGGLLFTAVYLVEGATRPGYSAWADSISALSLGSGGWIQQVDFILFGSVVMASAFGWRMALAGGTGAMAYPVFRFVEGLGLIADGVFSQDSQQAYGSSAIVSDPTLQGQLHSAFAVLTLTAISAGWFVLARRFAAEPRWHRFGVYSVVAGTMTIIFIAMFGAMGPSGLAGLFERIGTDIGALVSLAIIARLLIQANRPSILLSAAGCWLPGCAPRQ